MRCGSHRERIHSKERERDTSVSREDRKLKVLFCLFGFRESFFMYTQTLQKKQKRMIFLFVYFLYTNTTRTIFLAYKRSITEESNNRLIWSFVLPFCMSILRRDHVLLFCSTLWNISTSAIFCFILYLFLSVSPLLL